MALKDFNGETFVAFIDISGFKQMMKNNKASLVLDKFYQFGYDLLQEDKYENISGIFISDCGIIYYNKESEIITNKLSLILNFIKDINIKMLENNFLLTTSVCYDNFIYEDRIELRNMSKNALIGNAYLNAYNDNENTLPKIKAGECRIVINDKLELLDINSNKENMNLKKTAKHYYYEYLFNTLEKLDTYKEAIKTIEEDYENSKGTITNYKFERIISMRKDALK